MSLVNRSSLVRKFKRAFGVLSDDFGATVSDELVGVVLVDDVSGDDVISDEYPRGAIGSSTSGPGGAGTRSKVGIQNPAGSGVDVFLESIWVNSTAFTVFQLRETSILPGAASAGVRFWRDLRIVGFPAAIIWDENSVGSVGNFVLGANIPSQSSTLIPVGMTLDPGQILLIQHSLDNLSLSEINWYWTERLREAQ